LLPWLLCLKDFYELSCGVATCLLPWLSLPGGLS
jgi:hypothetical protein